MTILGTLPPWCIVQADGDTTYLTHKGSVPTQYCAVPGGYPSSHSHRSDRLYRLLLLSIVATGIISSGVTRAAGSTPRGMSAMAMSIPSASPAEATFVAESYAAVAKMIAGMDVKPSGDVNRDFVAMMVPHHQGAIDMAEAELRYGRNEQLVRIAQQIIVEQLQEIAAMRIAVGERVSRYEALLAAAVPAASGAPSPVGKEKGAHSLKAEAPFIAENDSAMDRMIKGMTITPSGDVDHDFVAMMVPHHQGAIHMAETELRYGVKKNPRLSLIAQEIIVDQMQEIALMRLVVGEALPPSIASPTNPSPAPTRE